MSTVITAQKRDRAGKGAARAVRREMLTPGVVYGAKKDPVSVTVDPRDIMRALQTGAFYNTVYELDIDGKTEKVLPRDVQFHVVKDTIEHVDFLRVDDSSVVKVSVPIEYVGIEKNAAIKMGGRLQVVRREVELLAVASKIPTKLVADITNLKFGGIFRVSGLGLDADTKPTISDRDFVLASLKAPRGAASLEDEDESSEGGEE